MTDYYGWKSRAKGIKCSLENGYVTPLSEVDAKLLSQVDNLVEIRVLPLGGPPDEFWDALDRINSLRDFVPHYGLNEKGVRSLVKFPNLESLVIWGSGNWGERTSLEFLPHLRHLRILHIEECDLTIADVRRLKESCPALEEFLCEWELPLEQLKILRSIPTLKSISAFGFEMKDGEILPLN